MQLPSRPAWLRPILVVAGALIVVVVVIGLAGGWQQAEGAARPRVPEASAGTRIDAGPVEVEVHSWGVVRTKDYLADDTAIRPVLAVRLTVTTTADAVLPFPSHLLRPVTIAEDGWLTAVRAGDFTSLSRLTPGVSEEVIVTTPVADPDDLDALGDVPLLLDVMEYAWRQHSLSREVQWWEEAAIASVTIPRDQSFFGPYQDAIAEELW